MQAGDYVRLYSRTGNACVRVGVVQEYEGQVWGKTGILLVPAMDTRARVRRWIVRVYEALMPGAHTLYLNSDDVCTGNAREQMEGKKGGHVMWGASRMRKRPTNTAAPVPGAVEHGLVQEVEGMIGTPGGGTEQNGGYASAGDSSSGSTCTTSGNSDLLFTTPSEYFFSGRLAGMEKLIFGVAGRRKDKEEDGKEYGDPTAGLGSLGGGGVGYGAVADGDDISDVEIMKMSDIEEEADEDDANAASEKGKGKSRSRKKGNNEFWLKVGVLLYFPPQRWCYMRLRCTFCLQRVPCSSSLPSRESYSFSCLALSLITGAGPFD